MKHDTGGTTGGIQALIPLTLNSFCLILRELRMSRSPFVTSSVINIHGDPRPATLPNMFSVIFGFCEAHRIFPYHPEARF